jgi:hypothetical protein
MPDRDRDLAADLRLRPERPPVTRLSRRVLMGLAAVAAILISGALIWGLYQGQKKSTGGTELYNTENKPTPEGLTTLPRDYSGLSRTSLPPIAPGVPPLGPPLPGDLGRPIRNAQIPVPVPGEPAVDAEQQRIGQETEAARTSRLFATTNTRERPTTPTALPATTIADHTAGTLTGRVEPPPFDPDSILNMQDRKLAFLTAAVDRKTRTAGGPPEPQYPADHHHPAGLPGAGDHQSRSSAFALQELRAFAMAKLKLSAVPDDRPVKLTVQLPAAVHRDLVAYAELLACQNGHEIEPAKLVAPMLARFMSTDRAFLSARRKGKGTS